MMRRLRPVVVALALVAGTAHAAPPSHAAEDTLAEARRAAQSGRTTEAASLAERAVGLYEKSAGVDSTATASAYMAWGTMLVAAGDPGRAEPALAKAIAIWEKTGSADELNVGGASAALASLYGERGEPKRALPLRKRVVDIATRLLGPAHPFTGAAVHNLGETQRALGDFRGALASFEKALAVREQALGPTHGDVAQTLIGISTTRVALGDLEGAAAPAERAAKIYKDGGPKAAPDLALALSALTVVAYGRGDYPRARKLAEFALGIRRDVLGTSHVLTGDAANNLAMVLFAMGDYREAEEGYRAAAGIHGKALGASHPSVAGDRVNLAEVLLRKGDWPSAQAVLEPAIQIYEKAYDAKHPSLAKPLSLLASLHELRGDLAGAEPLRLRVVEIQRASRGPDSSELGAAIAGLGVHYGQAGKMAEARKYTEEALVLYRRTLGPRHPFVGTVLATVGSFAHVGGDDDRAQKAFEEALSIDEAALGKDHPTVSDDLFNLGALLVARGSKDRAMPLLARGAASRDAYLSSMLGAGSEHQRRAAYAATFGESNLLLALAFGAPDDTALRELGFSTVLLRKGRLLDSLAGDVGALRRSADEPSRKLLDRIALARANVATLTLRGPPPGDTGDLTAALSKARVEVLQLENELADKSALFRETARPATKADVAGALPAGAVLVELVKYHPFAAHPTSLAGVWEKPRYGAFVLSPDGTLTAKDLGETREIDAAVNDFRGAIVRSPHGEVRPAARELRKKTFDPLFALVGGARDVFVAPDAGLNLLPFAALVGEDGHYLAERYLFTYVTSGRDLMRFRVGPPAGTDSVVVANPAFDKAAAQSKATPQEGVVSSRDRGLELADDAFLPLAGTAAEGTEVSKLLPGSALWTGDGASEAALKGVHGPRVLHIATHGFFVPVAKSPSSAATESPLLASVLPRIDDPFLRSGLALAGANVKTTSGEDGILTAQEATGLDLWGTRLVVLSACQSGLGDVVDGVEVQGLRRSLAIAGAETQVLSLWKVDDDATRALMTSYYQRLRDGGGRSEALRQAQLELIASPERTHPYYWAAFFAAGSPTTLDGKVVKPDVAGGASIAGAKVAPAHGCGCEVGAERGSSKGGVLLVLALALGISKRRRALREGDERQ
jgi:CHAT domain-containing protein/tetratricopeptide (TPR) repeat protein